MEAAINVEILAFPLSLRPTAMLDQDVGNACITSFRVLINAKFFSGSKNSHQITQATSSVHHLAHTHSSNFVE